MRTNQNLALSLVQAMLGPEGNAVTGIGEARQWPGQLNGLAFDTQALTLGFLFKAATEPPMGELVFEVEREPSALIASVQIKVTLWAPSAEAVAFLRNFYFHALFHLVSLAPEQMWRIENSVEDPLLRECLDEELEIARGILLDKVDATVVLSPALKQFF